MKQKVIIAGFMRAGTHSLKRRLEEEGKEVILVDEVLYNKDFKIEELLRSHYGDIPIYFIKRKDKEQHMKSLKKVQRMIHLRVLSNYDVEKWLNYEEYINRFKKVFTKVIVLNLEDIKFGYHKNKSKITWRIGVYIPIEVLLLYKNIKNHFGLIGKR